MSSATRLLLSYISSTRESILAGCAKSSEVMDYNQRMPILTNGLSFVNDPNYPIGGSFGKVYKIQCNNSHTTFALKTIGLQLFSGKFRTSIIDKVLREVKLISGLNSDRIVQYHNHWFCGPNSNVLEEYVKTHNAQFMDNDTNDSNPTNSCPNLPVNFLCIQMEFFEMTLKDWIESRQEQSKRDSREVYEIFIQVMEGLDYLHRKGIIHRDVKPANILMRHGQPSSSRSWEVKLGDFGLAIESNLVRETNPNQGTMNYQSPEMQRGSQFDASTDIYSAGITFQETRFTQMRILQLKQARELIGDGESLSFLNRILTFCNNIDFGLVSRMTAKEPQKRPKASKIIEILEARKQEESGNKLKL